MEYGLLQRANNLFLQDSRFNASLGFNDKNQAAASSKVAPQHYIDFFGFHRTRTLRTTSDALLSNLSFLWINLVMQRRKIIGSHKSEDEITALNYLNNERKNIS